MSEYCFTYHCVPPNCTSPEPGQSFTDRSAGDTTDSTGHRRNGMLAACQLGSLSGSLSGSRQ